MKNIVENQGIKNDKPLALTYEQLKQQLDAVVAECARLKSATPQPFGPLMMQALDAYEQHQDDVPETGMLNAFFILRDSIAVETPNVTAALAALEEKDQSIAELNVKLFDQSILLDAAISRAEAAGRREEHLKADVAVMGNRIAELERANAAQDDHINQQQDRIDTLEKRNGELGKHVGKLEKLLKGTEESLIASVDNVAELEQRLQQPIKLPNKNDDEFWFGSTFQVAKFDRAVERSILAAGFKFKGE
ncbi:hypothetical protein FOT80_00840 [Serratia fonticola]|nr:hypothetical protein [Serratia fonticola]